MAQQHIGLAKETSYGTAATPPTDFLEGAESADLALQRENEEVVTIRSHSARIVNLLNQRVVGTITCIGNYQELGLLFKHFWGAVVTTGAGPFTHTFPGGAGIPDAGRVGFSLTIEVKEDATLATRYIGCKVTQLRISGDTGRSPRIEFTFLGKSVTTATPAAFIDPGFNPILIGDVDLDFDGTILPVTGFDLTIERPVSENFAIGDAAIALEPRDGKMSVSGSLTMLFSNNTQYSKFTNNNDVAVHLVMNDGTRSLTLNMNKTKLRSHNKPITIESAQVVAAIEWLSFFDTTATENAQAVLVNADATIP